MLLWFLFLIFFCLGVVFVFCLFFCSVVGLFFGVVLFFAYLFLRV